VDSQTERAPFALKCEMVFQPQLMAMVDDTPEIGSTAMDFWKSSDCNLPFQGFGRRQRRERLPSERAEGTTGTRRRVTLNYNATVVIIR
jgi:hypothetical protein